MDPMDPMIQYKTMDQTHAEKLGFNIQMILIDVHTPCGKSLVLTAPIPSQFFV